MNLLDEIRIKHRKAWQSIMWYDAKPIVIKSQHPLSAQHNKLYALCSVTDTVAVFYTERTDLGMTATFIESYAFIAQTCRPVALDLRSDGMIMYISSEDSISEYSLSEPWSVASAEWNGSLDIEGEILDIEWHPEGIRLQVFLKDGCESYEMKTAWNLCSTLLD